MWANASAPKIAAHAANTTPPPTPVDHPRRCQYQRGMQITPVATTRAVANPNVGCTITPVDHHAVANPNVGWA